MSVGSCNLHITYSDVYLVNCVYRLHGNTKHGFSHKQKRPLTRMTHSEICIIHSVSGQKAIQKGIISNSILLSITPFKLSCYHNLTLERNNVR